MHWEHDQQHEREYQTAQLQEGQHHNNSSSVASGENRSLEDFADMSQERRESSTSENDGSMREDAEKDQDKNKVAFGPEMHHDESTAPNAFHRHTENEKTDSGNEAEDMDRHRRGNMRQKDADVAGEVDISVQMYRYLKHNDLKRKIVDLEQREHSFAIRQSWGDALRLREMKNELILLKNKNLFENRDLYIDEVIRKSGMEVIQAREELNNKRTKMSNTTLYR